MDEERIGSIGGALVVATTLALGAAVAAEAFGFAFFDDADDAALTSKLVLAANDRKAMRPLEACIQQYGPGERWTPSRLPLPGCAKPAGVVPNDVLIVPVRQQ